MTLSSTVCPRPPFACVDERRQCLALSARRPRRRRAAVLQRKDKAMEGIHQSGAALFLFSFYFKEPFLTSFSTVCPRWRTPSAGFALSVPIWASSLLKARAPRRERPARLRRRLSPCRFSPLAASSAGGLGAASEAAPVRPYPKTTSTEDQGPAQEHRRGNHFLLPASLGRPLRRRRPLPFLAPVGSLVSSPRQDHSFFDRRGSSCGTVSGGASLRGRVRWRR